MAKHFTNFGVDCSPDYLGGQPQLLKLLWLYYYRTQTRNGKHGQIIENPILLVVR